MKLKIIIRTAEEGGYWAEVPLCSIRVSSSREHHEGRHVQNESSYSAYKVSRYQNEVSQMDSRNTPMGQQRNLD